RALGPVLESSELEPDRHRDKFFSWLPMVTSRVVLAHSIRDTNHSTSILDGARLDESSEKQRGKSTAPDPQGLCHDPVGQEPSRQVQVPKGPGIVLRVGEYDRFLRDSELSGSCEILERENVLCLRPDTREDRREVKGANMRLTKAACQDRHLQPNP